MATVYTIGHSTRAFDELVAALKAHGIRALVDIPDEPEVEETPEPAEEENPLLA